VAQEEYQDKHDAEAAERQAMKARRQLSKGRFTQLTEKLTGGPERPGEQKIGRSPIVLGLVGLTIGSSILAGIIYSRTAMERENRKLKEAQTSLEQQRYLDADGSLSRQ
jgi:hypothetical protein